MEDLANIFLSGLYSSIHIILKLAIIVFPLTISYEFLKGREKSLLKWRLKFLGISGAGIITLLTGIIVGLTYGAGIIVHSVRQCSMERKEAFLILLFLSICHAIIEDTLIFVVIGADGAILIVTRFIVATFLTFFAARMIKKR